MVKHIVVWDFKDEFSREENLKNAEIIKKNLESLISIIPEIVSLEVNYNMLSTSNGDIVLVSEFNNEEDLNIYSEHPEHKKAGEFNKIALKNRRCFDFIVK